MLFSVVGLGQMFELFRYSSVVGHSVQMFVFVVVSCAFVSIRWLQRLRISVLLWLLISGQSD